MIYNTVKEITFNLSKFKSKDIIYNEENEDCPIGKDFELL